MKKTNLHPQTATQADTKTGKITEKTNRKITKFFINLFLLILIVLGTAVLLYPTISNWYQTRKHQDMINSYESDSIHLPEEVLEQEWQKAVEYNESLIGKPVKDPFLPGSGMALASDYMDVLSINGIMGYLDIPIINIHLPIYHGTSDEALNKGVGHIGSTAFPIGSEGINPILSAHTGIPSAKLFSDLVKMKLGDMFSVRVLNRTMYYKVDNIQVILPEETKNLAPVPGKDYVTLITCTPYGINSHRLVVRGERCYEIANSLILENNTLLWTILLICSSWIALMLLFMVIIRHIRQEKLQAEGYKNTGSNERLGVKGIAYKTKIYI